MDMSSGTGGGNPELAGLGYDGRMIRAGVMRVGVSLATLGCSSAEAPQVVQEAVAVDVAADVPALPELVIPGELPRPRARAAMRTCTAAAELRARAELSAVERVEFSPDGRHVVVGGGSVGVWSVDHGELVRTIAGGEATFAADGSLVVGRRDAVVRLAWPSLTEIQRYRSGVALRPDEALAAGPGGEVLVGTMDGEATVWAGDDEAPRCQLRSPTKYMRLLRWIPGRAQVVGCTGENGAHALTRWDARSCEVLATAPLGAEGCAGLAVSPRGDVAALGTERGAVIVWDLQSMRAIRSEPPVSEKAVEGLAYAPDGAFLAALRGEPLAVMVWDASGARRASTIRPHMWIGNTLAYSPDGGMLAIGTGSTMYGCSRCGDEPRESPQDLWLWTPGEPAASRGLGRTQGRGAVVDLAPDGRSYRVDERERRRALVDMLSGKLLAREVEGQFNPTGDRLVKVGDEIITAISLWDTRTGAQLTSLQPLSPVRLIRFSADGVRMLTVHRSGLRQVWDIQSGRLIQTIRALGDRGDPDEHGDGALSPDGRRALLVDKGAAPGVWDVDTGQLLAQLDAATENAGEAPFDASGERVLVIGEAGARVFATANGRRVDAFTEVKEGKLAPDGTRVVALVGGELQVVEVASGAVVQRLASGPVGEYGFSPDGSVWTRSYAGDDRIWDLSLGTSRVNPPGHVRARLRADRWVSLSAEGLELRDDAGALLASHMLTFEGWWTTWTPDGRVDASRDAPEVLAFVEGLEVCAGKLRRTPGLWRKMLR